MEPLHAISTSTPDEIEARALASVYEVWDIYSASLPAEATRSWSFGAIYARDSDISSLVGEAASAQVAAALQVLAAEKFYVPRELIFFDQMSGTEAAPRPGFQDMLHQAFDGKFLALGTYVSSRLFRNMEEAIAIKRKLRMQGIKLFWMGRPQMDERTPTSWQLDRQTELADELHSRQTGWFVGMQKEYLSSQGYPQGPLPEGFVVVERMKGLIGGRQGRAIRWDFNEPLATHIKEGAALYLTGATYRDLATRSKASEFNGYTPNGIAMTITWWHSTLMNPKYAGLHLPSVYTGYKPGKESPKRAVRNRDSVLIPCRLPALISVEDHRRIVALSQSRWKGPKWRPSYHEDLTTGILYDADCGHRLHVKQRTHYGRSFLRVRCYKAHTHEPEAPSYDIHDSVAELDALLAELRFVNPELLEQIAAQLKQLDADLETVELERPDPRADELRSAIANLSDELFKDTRKLLVDQLKALEEQHRPLPVKRTTFRGAVADLEHWAHVWATASLREKNELLTAAGLRVYLSRRPIRTGKKIRGRSSAIAEIRVKDPAFGAALALALGDRVKVVGDQSLTDVANLWRQVDWVDIETPNVHRPTILLPNHLLAAVNSARDHHSRLMRAA
jgi:hypothetical protein